MGNVFHTRQDEIVEAARAQAAEPQVHAREVRSSIHPVFRTEVAVCDLTVTGVLPGTVRPQGGTIAIGGDVRRLSCDEALELVDALLLVVTRMDVVAEERHSATSDTTPTRGD
jgi:hypothetical protein